ncbi:MAG: hypothetical protein ACR652_03050 [Methylocystis sp.]|uniref:hypothetical protein n=1 Tax=Methylocystis sp. TaxID=1911079 RepID=UPI003DA26202
MSFINNNNSVRQHGGAPSDEDSESSTSSTGRHPTSNNAIIVGGASNNSMVAEIKEHSAEADRLDQQIAQQGQSPLTQRLISQVSVSKRSLENSSQFSANNAQQDDAQTIDVMPMKNRNKGLSLGGVVKSVAKVFKRLSSGNHGSVKAKHNKSYNNSHPDDASSEDDLFHRAKAAADHAKLLEERRKAGLPPISGPGFMGPSTWPDSATNNRDLQIEDGEFDGLDAASESEDRSDASVEQKEPAKKEPEKKEPARPDDKKKD